MRFLNYLNEGVYDPSIFKAIFLAGGPGSGKSFVSKKTTSGMGLKSVNSDTLFEIMAKEANIDLSNMKFDGPDVKVRDEVRNKAKRLTNKQLDTFLKGRLGLVIDGTGAKYNAIEKQVKKLRELGYDTFMIFVNTSLDVALERNKKRARTVPEEIVTSSWNAVQENMGKFQTLFGSDKFKIVDNNVYSDDKNVFADAWKEVMKFAKKPIKNVIAKAWIEQALDAKNKTK
jgi:cytidylate kinase